METIHFLIAVLNLVFVAMGICEVPRYRSKIHRLVQNDNFFQSKVRSFSFNEFNENVRGKPLPRSVDSIKDWFGLDKPIESASCDQGMWAVKDIVASLHDCEWKQTVVVFSDTMSYIGKKRSFTDCEHGLTNNAFTDLRYRNLDYNARPAGHWKTNSCPFYITHYILEVFRASLIPVQHFQLSRASNGQSVRAQLEEVLWTSYRRGRARTFVWISPRPWELLDAAHAVFRREHRGRAALMVHRALFLLVGLDDGSVFKKASESPPSSRVSSCLTGKSALLEKTGKRLASCEFDNVLFLSAVKNTSSLCHVVDDDVLPITLPHTLMWRTNRTREFEAIQSLDVEPVMNRVSRFNPPHTDRQTKQRCPLFPNIRNTMNGRPLVFVSKEWRNFLVYDEAGGSVKYSGLVYELARVLSTSMNFSFTFSPDPSATRNVTWDELRALVVSGGVGDALFSLFYTTASVGFNFSQPYPFYHINMTGAYASKPQTCVRLFVDKLDPHIIIFCVVSFVCVLILYTYLCNLREPSRRDDLNQGSTHWHTDSQTTCDLSYLWHFWRQMCEMFFPLHGSCYSQGNVPQPCFFSGKILLFFWFMFVIILTAIFKGHLASRLMSCYPSPPFATFRELVNRTDHRWGHNTDSSFLNVMRDAKGDILSELYSKMTRFAEHDPGVTPATSNALVLKASREERFVAIIGSLILKEILYANDIPNIKVIPDSLGINGLAPILPPDSELTQLMSEHIIALHETGIFNELADRMFSRIKTNPSANSSLIAHNHSGVQTYDQNRNNKVDIEGGCLFSAFLALAAFLVLLIELAMVHAKTTLSSGCTKTLGQALTSETNISKHNDDG